MPFRPNIFEIISIDGKEYRFNPQPANEESPFAITGKRATVYQLQDEHGALYALKVFSLAYRSSHAVSLTSIHPWLRSL